MIKKSCLVKSISGVGGQGRQGKRIDVQNQEMVLLVQGLISSFVCLYYRVQVVEDGEVEMRLEGEKRVK